MIDKTFYVPIHNSQCFTSAVSLLLIAMGSLCSPNQILFGKRFKILGCSFPYQKFMKIHLFWRPEASLSGRIEKVVFEIVASLSSLPCAWVKRTLSFVLQQRPFSVSNSSEWNLAKPSPLSANSERISSKNTLKNHFAMIMSKTKTNRPSDLENFLSNCPHLLARTKDIRVLSALSRVVVSYIVLPQYMN